MFNAKVLRVMISSPGDVPEARQRVQKVTSTWNVRHAASTGVVLLPWRWEEDAITSLSEPGQDSLNRQGVDQADVVIAIFGDRIGTATQNAASGTVEEIERARERGVVVHLYFSSADMPRTVEEHQFVELTRFQAAAKTMGLHAEYADTNHLAELVDRDLTDDVRRLRQKEEDSYFDVDTDRVYDLYETTWELSRSTSATPSFAGRQESRRHVVSRSARGIDRFDISLARESDQLIPFGEGNDPRYVLHDDSSRTDFGTIRLNEPHQTKGARFAQAIEFSPPLDVGQAADLHFTGVVPQFKIGSVDLFEPATRGSKLGLRDWDYVSLNVSFPMRRLVYSVFFPDELGVEVLGVRAGRGSVDPEESARLRREGFATQEHVVRDGVAGVLLRLDMPKPRLKWTYRLCWRPPRLGR